MKTFNELFNSLLEAPMIIQKIDRRYLKKYLIKPIQKALATNSFEKEHNDIFSCITHTYSLYVASKHDYVKGFGDIIGAVYLSDVNKKVAGFEVSEEKMSKKFFEDYNSLVLKCFSVHSENDLIIMSDSMHTQNMANIWKKWLSNDDYGVTLVGFVDYNKDELIDITIEEAYKSDNIKILIKVK